jgi:hypothetical protein
MEENRGGPVLHGHAAERSGSHWPVTLGQRAVGSGLVVACVGGGGRRQVAH